MGSFFPESHDDYHIVFMGMMALARIGLIVMYVAAGLWPGLVFFGGRHGLLFMEQGGGQEMYLKFFPLFGLYAFFLVWSQIMIGANLRWLSKIFPRIEWWHRRQGVFTLLFALTHPILLMLGVGLATYAQMKFVAPELTWYVLLGEIQLTLICLTAITAMLMRRPWLQRRWKYIHFANYAVFISVWVHSWFLGSDVQSTSLKFLWIFFGLTYLASLMARFIGHKKSLWQVSRVDTPSPAFIPVGQVSQLQVGKPLCARAGGTFLTICQVGEQVYALANACSHAGAPLCEGKQEENSITCPLHGSQFDIRNGQVLRGPAQEPQKTYPVKIQDGQILVQV